VSSTQRVSTWRSSVDSSPVRGGAHSITMTSKPFVRRFDLNNAPTDPISGEGMTTGKG